MLPQALHRHTCTNRFLNLGILQTHKQSLPKPALIFAPSQPKQANPEVISNNPDFLSLLKFHVPLAYLFFFLKIKQKNGSFLIGREDFGQINLRLFFSCTSILSQDRIAIITLAGKHISGVLKTSSLKTYSCATWQTGQLIQGQG